MQHEPPAIQLTEDQVIEVCERLQNIIGNVAAISLTFAGLAGYAITDDERAKLAEMVKDAQA